VQTLSEVKGVAACLPTVDGWDPSTAPGAAAPMLEYRSLLGPLLRLSAFPDGAVRPSPSSRPPPSSWARPDSLSFPSLQPNLPLAYFPEPSTMGRGNIDSASASLRGTLRGVQVRPPRLSLSSLSLAA